MGGTFSFYIVSLLALRINRYARGLIGFYFDRKKQPGIK
jgi:hypothetical protein